MLPESVNFGTIAVSIASLVVGALLTTLFLTRDQRLKHSREQFLIAERMQQENQAALQVLTDTLGQYLKGAGDATPDEFVTLSKAAHNYLMRMKITADAILCDQVPPQIRDGTLLPQLVEAADKVIPAVYKTQRKIARAAGLTFPKDFDRANYQSIFEAVEKFGARASYARQSTD